MRRLLLAVLLAVGCGAHAATNHFNILDTTTITGGSFVDPSISGTITLPSLSPSSLVLTNGSRVLGSYAGQACTNQLFRGLSAAGLPTCSQVLNADLAGSIAAAKLIGTDIATVGTITAGTWHATAVGTQYGGTGQNWSISSGVPLFTAGAASMLSTSGTGALARVVDPVFTTPTIGAALATSINGNAITAGSGTLTLGASKTLTSSNTLTLAGTDGSTLNVGTGGTLGTAAYTAATAYAPAAGSTSITTLGTVTTGTWSATAISPTRGGTGQSTTATSGRYLKGDGTNWGASTGSASGTGACSANTWASTLSSDAAPTCTQPSISAGISGLGTGVATALGNSTNASGGVVTFSGNIGAASATSVNFGGTSLGVYAEGTFSPGISFGGGTTGITYGAQVGVYTRVGNRACVDINVTLTAKGASTGTALVTGLPFTVKALTGYFPALAIGSTSALTAGTPGPTIYAIQGTATAQIASYDSATGVNTSLTHAALTNTTSINASGCYAI